MIKLTKKEKQIIAGAASNSTEISFQDWGNKMLIEWGPYILISKGCDAIIPIYYPVNQYPYHNLVLKCTCFFLGKTAAYFAPATYRFSHQKALELSNYLYSNSTTDEL